MEKGKLVELLEGFNKDAALSAELKIVLHNSDNEYELFSTKPDPNLIKDLIKGYIDELEQFADPYSSYELHSVLTDNENNWNYLYFDGIESTKVSKEIFGLKAKVERKYDKDLADFGSIFGFVIDIYNSETQKIVRIFKKLMPTYAMKKKKWIGISFEGDTFSAIDKDTVYFQRNIDILRIDNHLIVRNYKTYERDFKFDEVLKKRVEESLKILLQVKGIEFTQQAREHISKLNNTKRRKLINCVLNNKILTEEKYKYIKSQSNRYLKHEFKISLDERIIINTLKDVDALIKILNREINKNSGTNEVFHTPTKKLLAVYQAKNNKMNK